jgi:choline dehydrogenase-like flavoprotein
MESQNLVVNAIDSATQRSSWKADWLVTAEHSICHAAGTCRMGADEDSVVERVIILRVHRMDISFIRS